MANRYTVQFYERNSVSVQVSAKTKEDAIRQVMKMLEEGLDYDSSDVQVEYSDTEENFTVYNLE